MSRFSGRVSDRPKVKGQHNKGVIRALHQKLHSEAEERNAKTPNHKRRATRMKAAGYQLWNVGTKAKPQMQWVKL